VYAPGAVKVVLSGWLTITFTGPNAFPEGVLAVI
jgi:hypothetical protein